MALSLFGFHSGLPPPLGCDSMNSIRLAIEYRMDFPMIFRNFGPTDRVFKLTKNSNAQPAKTGREFFGLVERLVV